MNFHNRMMNIQEIQPMFPPLVQQSPTLGYKFGHRDARHVAAEIANEADALILEMREALKHCRDWLDAAGVSETMPVILQLKAALAKTN